MGIVSSTSESSTASSSFNSPLKCGSDRPYPQPSSSQGAPQVRRMVCDPPPFGFGPCLGLGLSLQSWSSPIKFLKQPTRSLKEVSGPGSSGVQSARCPFQDGKGTRRSTSCARSHYALSIALREPRLKAVGPAGFSPSGP